jgi:type II secretory pathway pseudopilin PulG
MTNSGKTSGFTLIETMIASIVVAVMVAGSLNLITTVYRNITDSQLKTVSMSLASERINYIKGRYNFNTIPITNESLLPDPLTNLESDTSHFNYNTITVGNMLYKVYTYVQYAVPDSDGNLIATKPSELPMNYDHNIVQASVVVQYSKNGFERYSKMSTIISNKQISTMGSVVSGKIRKVLANGTVTDPGNANATVYFLNYPQYTGRQMDASGSYTVNNVAPGTYTLLAKGAGLSDSYYVSNPITVPDVPTVVANVNITCAAVDGGSVAGNVYWDAINTPTPTPIDTPPPVCQENVWLYASGVMCGKTPVTTRTPGYWMPWNNPQEIHEDNGLSSVNYADTINATVGKKLYSDFEDFVPTPGLNYQICRVVLHMSLNSMYGEADLNVRFRKVCPKASTTRTPEAWANASTSTNTWTGTSATNYNFFHVDNVWLFTDSHYMDITALYADWTWTKVNDLGACFLNANHISGSMAFWLDYGRLEIDYKIVTPSPSATSTPATPPPTPTPHPSPCAGGAMVSSLDNLSVPTTVAECGYQLDNIDTSAGFTTMLATHKRIDQGLTISYAAMVTGVPVAIGTTTILDIFLYPSSLTPTVFGQVKDANTLAPLVGAQVYLSDPLDNTVTTSGGGWYTILNAMTGNWNLTASLLGYAYSSAVNLPSVVNGLNPKAPDILMFAASSATGIITDDATGNPLSGRVVTVYDNAGNNKGSDTTDETGYFKIDGVPVGSGYKILCEIDTSNEQIAFPTNPSYYFPVSFIQGVLVTNKDFRIKQKYAEITGNISLTGLSSTQGLVIIAYPSSVTLRAETFRMDQTNQNLQVHANRQKVSYPYYGIISDQNATFNISAPVGTTVELVAYYSYISFTSATGRIEDQVKTLKRYKKVIGTITISVNGNPDQNITGNPDSSWTAY